MVLELAIAKEVITNNLNHFLLVLSVSLDAATLPQIFNWFSKKI